MPTICRGPLGKLKDWPGHPQVSTRSSAHLVTLLWTQEVVSIDPPPRGCWCGCAGVGRLGWKWLLRIRVGRELQTFRFCLFICPGTGSVFPSFLLRSSSVSLHLSMSWVQDGTPQKRSSEFCFLGPLGRKAEMIHKKEDYCFIASSPPPQFSLHSLENQASSLMLAFCFFFFFGSAFKYVLRI